MQDSIIQRLNKEPDLPSPIELADQALYMTKMSGRNTIRVSMLKATSTEAPVMVGAVCLQHDAYNPPF